VEESIIAVVLSVNGLLNSENLTLEMRNLKKAILATQFR